MNARHEMPPENLQRVEAVFNEALALPEGDRASLIELRCAGDIALMAEVSSLLRACVEEEKAAAARLQALPAVGRCVEERKRVGAYEIDRLIGRGGMGAVYVAHRADGNFEQQVAVKLIDLPLATDLFRERFRLERQILAGLNHPWIARLLDGGVTAEGEPFLVMEYVDGLTIHRFCEERNLPLSDRLRLFKNVCEAVQFAHQNLVVHRDLKPDNILVVGDGTPRLLDFGTAKLLSPSAAGPDSELTRQGFQSFTPQYASPEQVLGLPISTASDTYSLGVLLYLLITGTLPYELKEFTTAEMVRVICEEAPRRPALAGSPARHLDPDLEAIVLKALRKEPNERYLTAAQLAADVHAFLDGRTVSARRGTFTYRAGKFARRHRIALLAAAVMAVTVLAGVGGVLWQSRVANLERRKAEARAVDLRELSNSLLSELDEAIKDLPGSTGAQRLLVTRVLEHLDRASKDAAGDRQTQLDLVNAYTRLGNIQGNPYDQNLGDRAGALASLDKAVAIATSLTHSRPADRDSLRALASVLQSRSEVLWGMEKTPEAVAAMRNAVAVFDQIIAGRDTTPLMICEAASAYGTLADELGQPGTPSMGDLAGALDVYRKVIALHEKALSLDPAFLRARRGLMINELKVGNVEIETDPAQALKDYDLAQERFEALPESKQNTLPALRMRANVLRKRATALRELTRFAEAAPLFNQALDIQRKIAGQDPKDSRSQFDLYVDLTQAANDFEDAADPAVSPSLADRHRNLQTAVSLLKPSQSVMLQLLKVDPSNDDWRAGLADVDVRLGTAQQELGNVDGAAALTSAAVATLKTMAEKHPDTVFTLDMEISALLNARPLALRDPKLAVERAEHEALLTSRHQPRVLLSLAQAYRAAGRIQDARASARAGLALFPIGAPRSFTARLLEMQEK
jgi:tetratricopeptide (TPR) repeat protein/predicted Ser/Thr protein kinase